MMIREREELDFYLAADRYALGHESGRPNPNDLIWRYQIALRKVAFYKAQKTTKANVLRLTGHQQIKRRLGLKLGFDIGVAAFGPGLRINHFGNVVVNGSARIGAWCDIHQGTNIGSDISRTPEALVPQIGTNVWIGPGAKLFGRIKVGDHVVIGANSVVGRSFPSGVTIGGIPAKVLSETGTESKHVSASASRSEMFFEEHPEFREFRSVHFSSDMKDAA